MSTRLATALREHVITRFARTPLRAADLRPCAHMLLHAISNNNKVCAERTPLSRGGSCEADAIDPIFGDLGMRSSWSFNKSKKKEEALSGVVDTYY